MCVEIMAQIWMSEASPCGSGDRTQAVRLGQIPLPEELCCRPQIEVSLGCFTMIANMRTTASEWLGL